MEESEEDFHIFVTNTLGGQQTRILKHDDLFGVFDRFGDIRAAGRSGAYGLYQADMRHLSRYALRLGGQRLLLLSSTVKEDNAVLTVDLTNPDIAHDGEHIPADTIHVLRETFIVNDTCRERIEMCNYGDRPVRLPLSIFFTSDFADIFEVRGTQRDRRGTSLKPRVGERRVQHLYEGLDGVLRVTEIEFTEKPDTLEGRSATFWIELEPDAKTSFGVLINCIEEADVEVDAAGEAEDEEAPVQQVEDSGQLQSFGSVDYDDALSVLSRALASQRTAACRVRTSNEMFNRWIRRSFSDLCMLVTKTAYGPYPYAGTPWFSTVFGRDGIITAYQMLWVNPALARGVLQYLAATQATESVAEQDAEPGKILHETRRGEMSRLGEVPFRRYYGTIDATPLFVVLAGAYLERTNDRGTIEHIWPAIREAIRWIDEYGDQDGDGYVEYATRTQKGLTHQGWKDSEDSVFYADGSPVEGPVALCEVQAYVYGARLAAGDIAELLGEEDFADEQRQKADELRQRFERDFWSDRIGTYVIALDGHNEPCEVRASNAGQCLLTGIASPERALAVADQLMDDSFYTGWGIRTLADTEPNFNPLSYHNGSIWPHDNSLIAAGFSRYGLRNEAVRLLDDMGSAAQFFDLHRVPELFCGFERRSGQGPTLYPVACSPQAWAAGTVFTLLSSVLGLEIDGREGVVTFREPVLPESLVELDLRRLDLVQGTVDLKIRRHPNDVGVEILDRTGDVEVRVVK